MYKHLPKEIYILFTSNVIIALGNFVYPFLTLFLTKKLNYTEFQTGNILLVSSILYVPGSILGGILCDKWSRKNTLVLFTILSCIFFMICGFYHNRNILPVILIIANIFNGVAQPANNAMVGDYTTEQNRNAAFSLLYLGHNLGFAVGPMIAGYLFNNYINFLFIGNALITFISVILIWAFIKEDHFITNIKESYNENDISASENSLKLIWDNKPLLYFLLISMVLSFVFAQNNFTLPLQMQDIFLNKGPEYYGMLMSVNAIVVIVFTVAITSLTDKFKPSLNIALSGLFCFFGFGMLYFCDKLYLFVISTIVWTIGEILNSTNSNVYLTNNAPATHRGRFNSIFSLLTGVGYAISPSIMGKYIELFKVKNSWILVSILALVVFAVMIFIYYKEIHFDSSDKVSVQ